MIDVTNTLICRIILVLMLSAGMVPVAVTAATAADGTEAAVLEELRIIRQILERIEKQGLARSGRKSAPKTGTVSVLETRPSLGSKDAPVTVVEFTDFQCPFCRRFIQSTFPLLKRDFIDTGKVRWLVRDMPLGFHSEARKAAQAAHCAGEQERFWEMRDSLFRNSSKLDEAALRDYASELGLDASAFADCLASDRHLTAIGADTSAARALGITGTPTFVIGASGADSVTGRIIIGAQSPAVFSAEINKLLQARQ